MQVPPESHSQLLSMCLKAEGTVHSSAGVLHKRPLKNGQRIQAEFTKDDMKGQLAHAEVLTIINQEGSAN